MIYKEVAQLTLVEKKQVFKLWNNEYPSSIGHSSIADFEEYLNELEDLNHVLVLNGENEIKGWYFQFVRESELNFGMILDVTTQGKGIGTGLLNRAKEKVTKLNGWAVSTNAFIKKDGSSYRSPLPFYKKNGFSIVPEKQLKTGKISAIKICWKKP